MRIDASNPFRRFDACLCTTNGRWCKKRWVTSKIWCERASRRPAVERRKPCPELKREQLTVFEIIKRLAKADPYCLVLNGEGTIAASVLWQSWKTTPIGGNSDDVLGQAAGFGACPCCDWTCLVCKGKDTEAECRYESQCFLAERHVQLEHIELIRWVARGEWYYHREKR